MNRSTVETLLAGVCVLGSDRIAVPRTRESKRLEIARLHRARAQQPFFTDPGFAAVADGFKVDLKGPPIGEDDPKDGWVRYAYDPDERVCGLSGYFRLASALLHREGISYVKADAWLLACELALPRTVRHTTLTRETIVHAQPFLPVWLLGALCDAYGMPRRRITRPQLVCA